MHKRSVTDPEAEITAIYIKAAGAVSIAVIDGRSNVDGRVVYVPRMMSVAVVIPVMPVMPVMSAMNGMSGTMMPVPMLCQGLACQSGGYRYGRSRLCCAGPNCGCCDQCHQR